VRPSERLTELGLELPPVPTPAAAYQPWSRLGTTVFTAGQLPFVGGVLPRTGRLGVDLTTDEGIEQARVAGLNALAAAAAGAGSIDHVRIAKITVFVASDPSFTEQHLVANGATQVISEVLGDERGVHARCALGVAVLPMGAPVEVEAVAEVLAA
jgi:enamine deaminase RidA (YjgF/YER057c/UK114 family)